MVVVVVVVDFGEDDIATCAEVRRRFEIEGNERARIRKINSEINFTFSIKIFLCNLEDGGRGGETVRKLETLTLVVVTS